MYQCRRSDGFCDGPCPETTGATDCLFAKKDGTGLIGCGKQNPGSLGLFLESDDGAVWSKDIGFTDVKYRICPEGTVGNAACARYFESNCGDNEDNDVDGLTDCDDDDCAASPACGGGGEGEGEGEGGGSEGEGEQQPGTCTCAGVDGGALAFGLLALLRRRRR